MKHSLFVELKIEMVCDEPPVRNALSAIIETHPNEEPAFAVRQVETPESLQI